MPAHRLPTLTEEAHGSPWLVRASRRPTRMGASDMLKHQWILEPARDHFDTCRSEPCHAYVEWSRSSCGTTYADLFIDTLEFTHTAADIRAAMAWYRSTGWLLTPADEHFRCGRGDETASGFVTRMREGYGWRWRTLAANMHAWSARSADALRAACKRLDEECREEERNG